MLTSSLTASSSSSPTALFPSSTSSFTAPSPCSLSFPFLNASTRTPKTKWEKTSTLRIQASMSSSMIEKEVPEAQRPTTFLRETDENASSSSDSIRARFEKMIREAQDSVCSAIELADGGGKFKEDVWSRHGGGGGINRVLQDGAVFEKSGVNVSVVYGVMPPEAYRAAKPSENGDVKPGPIPFFAVGISSVLHPKNPFAPTLHFNYRYFETDAPKDALGAPKQWWFGGGPKGCL